MTTLREAAEKALEALTESIDLVRAECTNDWRNGLPSRAAQLAAMKEGVAAHEAAIAALSAALAVQPQAEREGLNAVVYPHDGTASPFTVINLGQGAVMMGDAIHDQRLPALWFGKDGKGMGHEEDLNREAKEGETLAVVAFSNVEGLDVLLQVVQRIRRLAFPAAPPAPAHETDAGEDEAMTFRLRIARLLAELHGEETLSEQQCARYMGINLVSWRRIERTFSVGTWEPEGSPGELLCENARLILRDALEAARAALSQPAPKEPQ